MNGLPFEAQIKISEKIAEYGVYGEIYTLGLERLTREGIIPSLIKFYNENIVFDKNLNTIVMSENVQSYSKNRICDDKHVDLPYRSYRILNCPSFINKADWKYTQELKQGWFEKSFKDDDWGVTEIPLQICFGNNLLHGCKDTANFDSFYIRGRFKLSDNKGEYALVVQDYRDTHVLSEAYVNGERISLPSVNQFGETIIPLERNTVQGDNLIAVFLKLRKGNTITEMRMISYNIYIIPQD